MSARDQMKSELAALAEAVGKLAAIAEQTARAAEIERAHRINRVLRDWKFKALIPAFEVRATTHKTRAATPRHPPPRPR